jgi:hypothetical protein
MKKSFHRNIAVVIAGILLFCGAVNYTQASTVMLVASKTDVGIEEQFYVDVKLDPEDALVNGIEGSISYPKDLLSFVRAEDAQSIINLWIKKPNRNESRLEFSGIVPNGFSGVIDPFNSAKRSAALVLRLVFEAKHSGQAQIKAEPLTVTLNDGMGTTRIVPAVSVSIAVSDVHNPIPYKPTLISNPQLEAFVTRDPNLFSNKYALIFHATDQATGIKTVQVKEGSREWKTVSSPYLLEDQTRHSTIVVEATNFSDKSTIVTIEPLPYSWTSFLSMILYSVLGLILLFLIRKMYARNNKK